MSERRGREIDTREKIVAAATEIIREGGNARPSVRAVAARAGVGASTLRHYFPTQRSLLDATLAELYSEAMPDIRIRDTSVPARERLLECLWHLLEPFSTQAAAREAWKTIYEAFMAPEATEQARLGYLVLVRQAQQRIESWLGILDAEGALQPGEREEQAHFLMAVIDGLSLDRAFPAVADRPANEASTLRIAVDALIRPA